MKKLLLILLLLFTSCNQPLESTGEVTLLACHLQDCTETLISHLQSAEKSTCAFYDISDSSFERLLQDLDTDVIVDDSSSTNFPKRSSAGLMHHKFCIINDSVVITGSYNPSMDGDYNNLLVINSEPLAKIFNEIFISLKQPTSGLEQTIIHNNHEWNILACQKAPCKETLLKELSKAKKEIRLLLFTFTDKDVTTTLKKTNVSIKGVVESWQSTKYNQYYQLQDYNVILEQTHLIQHNKIFVIDNETVITGSYNPTKSAATKNDELLLIIHDPNIARAYALLVEDVYKKTQSFK